MGGLPVSCTLIWGNAVSVLTLAVVGAAAAALPAEAPIHWVDLGLTRGLDLGFFTLRWYSLAYLAGILLAYWHTSRMIRQPGAPMAHTDGEIGRFITSVYERADALLLGRKTWEIWAAFWPHPMEPSLPPASLQAPKP